MMKQPWFLRLSQGPAAVVGLAEGPRGLMHVKWRPRAARELCPGRAPAQPWPPAAFQPGHTRSGGPAS